MLLYSYFSFFLFLHCKDTISFWKYKRVLQKNWKRTCHASCFLFVSQAAYIYSGQWNERETAWQNNMFQWNEVGPLKCVLISVILWLHLYIMVQSQNHKIRLQKTIKWPFARKTKPYHQIICLFQQIMACYWCVTFPENLMARKWFKKTLNCFVSFS